MTTGDYRILFEYFDSDFKNSWFITIDQYVDSWNKNITYGIKNI